MKDKLEFGLKVNWDREEVLREIEEQNEEIRRLKAEIQTNTQSSTYFARMQLGRLVEQGSTEQLYAAPLHPYTRALLGAVPTPDPAACTSTVSPTFSAARDTSMCHAVRNETGIAAPSSNESDPGRGRRFRAGTATYSA